LPLDATFFNRPTLTVARELLGKVLVRQLNGHTLSGAIVEVEAYIGETDSACHAFKGRTPRTDVMFGPPGRAYVYFVYGMHFMLNIVTEAEGKPCAILVRAIAPRTGVAQMEQLRGMGNRNLTNGPARLCQALAIDTSFNRWDLTAGNTLWVEDAPTVPNTQIAIGPRIGITYATPADRAAPWRLWIKNNLYVSRK